MKKLNSHLTHQSEIFSWYLSFYKHCIWGILANSHPHNIGQQWCFVISLLLGFPGGSAGNESAFSAGDLGLIPGLGGSPGEGKGYPLQYSGLENSMDCTVHEVTNSWTRLGNFHFTPLLLGDSATNSNKKEMILTLIFLTYCVNFHVCSGRHLSKRVYINLPKAEFSVSASQMTDHHWHEPEAYCKNPE